MQLVVYGQQSLDTLEQLVTGAFEPVLNRGLVPMDVPGKDGWMGGWDGWMSQVGGVEVDLCVFFGGGLWCVRVWGVGWNDWQPI